MTQTGIRWGVTTLGCETPDRWRHRPWSVDDGGDTGVEHDSISNYTNHRNNVYLTDRGGKLF